jgi:anti-sigma factor RsiW
VGEDAALVALIDNELDQDARSRLLARLGEDEALRGRYEALRKTSAPIADALDGLLASAPLARLRAAIPKEEARRIVSWSFRSTVLRAVAAGLVVSFLAAGIGAWTALRFAPQDDREDWRSTVVEYMELNTNETFAFDDSDLSSQAKKLHAIGDKLKVQLTPDTLSMPGLLFKTAQLLSYDGAPLAEIVYVDAQGAPVAFCIHGGAEADGQAQSEKRGDLSLTSWINGGRGYLVIGRLPEQQIADLARTFERRFSKS